MALQHRQVDGFFLHIGVYALRSRITTQGFSYALQLEAFIHREQPQQETYVRVSQFKSSKNALSLSGIGH